MCIPNGHLLLIKEHPASVGSYNSSRIRDILKCHAHVRLVHPSVNSYDIIERSQSVITINSKVGVEAIVQQKSVIVLGPTFYRGKNLTMDVEALKDLPEVIQQALISEKLNVENVRDFLALVYMWSWPGELFDNAPENIEAFSNSLWRYMNARHLC
jgi:capsule polysaccharide export protein KpsC/LpsZ